MRRATKAGRVPTLRQPKPNAAQIERDQQKIYARAAQARLAFARDGLPLPIAERGLFHSPEAPPRRALLLKAPSVLSLKGNYDECLGFLYDYRWRRFVNNDSGPGRPRSLVIDMSSVDQMYLDAALVLVAEYHSGNLASPDFRPVIDDASWPLGVRRSLEMLGFYDLVQAQARTCDEDALDPDGPRFVPFASDTVVDGAQVDPVIERLKAIAGGTPKRVALYGALMEAVANVKGHAYPEVMPPRVEPISRDRWWAAGAYFSQSEQLEYAVYDQGVGIAETLPKKPLWEVISRICPPEFDDGDVIVGGIKYGRTSTGRAERGNGLWKICKLVRDIPNSSVRIMSGRGDVTYFGRGKPFKKVNRNPFPGTLVHWTLSLPVEVPKRPLA
jgi:hypothetical protein